MNEKFKNFAHGFLTLWRKFVPLSLRAKIILPVLWPISGLELLIFLKITKMINLREQLLKMIQKI